MALTRLFQLHIAKETVPGTFQGAGTLPTNASGRMLPIDPVLTINPETVERLVSRGTLSPVIPIAGAIPCSCTFRVECAGDTTGHPLWFDAIEACGFKKLTPFVEFTGGTVATFDFLHGEPVTGATFVGTAVTDQYIGASSLYCVETTPAGATETLTGTTSGGTYTAVNQPVGDADSGAAFEPSDFVEYAAVGATIASAPLAGRIFRATATGAVVESIETPIVGTFAIRVLYGTMQAADTYTDVSDAADQFTTTATPTISAVPTLSIVMIEDGRRKVIRGARGNVTWSGEVGNPMYLDFEFSGAFQVVADGGAVTVTHTEMVPPVLTGATIGIGNDDANFNSQTEEYLPCINSFSLNMGNGVVARRCMDDASGIALFEITTRAPVMTIDPELLPEASFPFLGSLTTSGVFRYRMLWGSATENQFLLWAPGCQPVSEAPGDRDGVATTEITANLTGTNADGTEGSEREVIFCQIP